VSSPAFSEDMNGRVESLAPVASGRELRHFFSRANHLFGRIRHSLSFFASSEASNVVPFALKQGPDLSASAAGLETTRINYELVLERAAQREIIDQLPVGIAMFWPDQRLCVANWQFIDRFGLSERWVADRPHLEDLLDQMRDNGTIGQQRDFAAWKRAKLETFAHLDGRLQEIWHLPNGKSERVTLVPNAMGGVTMLFEDVTAEYELKTAYNALLKTQKATLDSIGEAIAVFGPDGRLKLHNAAFLALWPLEESALEGCPHIREIASTCSEKLGHDETWNVVTLAVNAMEPTRSEAWNAIRRADGITLTLAITRLPDGGTMVSFSNLPTS
jgi:PAS domain-containing protein